MHLNRLIKITGIVCFVAVAAAAGLSAGQPPKANPAAPLPPVKSKPDRLYRALLGKEWQTSGELATLSRDGDWKPSAVDIAKAVEMLPVVDIMNQVGLLQLLRQEPQKTARWTDSLVDQIVSDNPANMLYPLYLMLLEQSAPFSPCGTIDPSLAKLWSAGDPCVTHMWARIASKANIGDWQTDFRNWKTRVEQAEQDAKAVIAELEERALKTSPK